MLEPFVEKYVDTCSGRQKMIYMFCEVSRQKRSAIETNEMEKKSSKPIIKSDLIDWIVTTAARQARLRKYSFPSEKWIESVHVFRVSRRLIERIQQQSVPTVIFALHQRWRWRKWTKKCSTERQQLLHGKLWLPYLFTTLDTKSAVFRGPFRRK